MSGQAVHWALHDAPMLTTETGHNDTTSRLTLVALADKAQGDPPVSFASVATLRIMTGLDRSAIQRALERLSKAALIAATGKRNKTTIWRLDLSQKRATSELEEVKIEMDLERARARERMRRLRSVRAEIPNRDHHVRAQIPNGTRPCSGADPEHGPDVRAQRPNVRDLRTNTQCSRILNGKDEQEPPSFPPRPPESDDGLLPRAALAETDTASAARRVGSSGAVHAVAIAFAEFWAVYPLRKAKKEAERSFAKAVKGGADPAEIIAGAKRYAEYRAGESAKFTKHPATWLNQGCWTDEYSEQRGSTLHQGHQPFRNPDDQSVYFEEL